MTLTNRHNCDILEYVIIMEHLEAHSLSTILWIITLGALSVALFPVKEKGARLISLTSSLLALAVTLKQYFVYFDNLNPNLQLVETYNWIGPIKFSLGVDGLAFSMVLLMAILLPVTILASKPIAQKVFDGAAKPRLYYTLIMFLALSVFLVFMSKDIFLFFLSWELELVPMYFLIAIWGSKNRNYASMKFLLYTFAAGVFLVLGIFGLLYATGFQTFDMVQLGQLAQSLGMPLQTVLFVLIGLCFIVKLPSVPFHTWLPDAHVEAPTPVSMLLAGILLKMGCYGLIRFALAFFPAVLVKYAAAIAILGVVNILYAAYVALIQTDFKKVIAYSSVSHMGFILLGLAALNTAGIAGATFQMFSHGLISAALFMLVGMIYERTHTRDISEFGGLAKVMPQTYYIFILAAMANLGLPGLSGFVGESMVFYGAYSASLADPTFKIATACAALGVVLTAAYMLWTNQRVFYGAMKEKWATLTDARTTELLILGVLLGLAILYGVYPTFINALYEPQLNGLAQSLTQFMG